MQQEEKQLLYEQQMQFQQQKLEQMEQHNASHMMIIVDGHLQITHSAPAPTLVSLSLSWSVPSSLSTS